MKSVSLKETAEKLRSEGKTYSQIKSITGISKSTLSNWLGEKYSHIFDKKAQIKHLKKIRPLAAKAKKAQVLLLEEEAWRQGVGVLKSLKESVAVDKLALGLLYWAEGAKYKGVSGLTFVNTDPTLMRLFVTLLRRAYPLDEKRFRVRIHLHYYHEKTRLTNFWSRHLQIPKSQIATPLVKPRSTKKRFKRNSKGICLLRYLDSSIRRQILAVAHGFAVSTSSHRSMDRT